MSESDRLLWFSLPRQDFAFTVGGSVIGWPWIIVLLASPSDLVIMHLPTVPLDSAGSDCANEEIFMFLDEMSHGHPHPHRLPPNVIADVNPYNWAPSNLPDGIWFLINSEENGPAEHGSWKVKVDSCKLFSNSMITGWMTSLEYFEGPYQHKTDWMMQQYWITHKGLSENHKETNSVCRVFLRDQQGKDHKKQQNTTETLIHSTELPVLKAQNASSSGSTNKSTVEKDDKTQHLAVTGEPANHLADLPPENDYFSRGDYLELLDLDDSALPSSSDSSSCVTMSSDECFDSLALLKELDTEINQDSNCKFNISTSFRPNEVVMAPASPGSYIGIEAPSEEIVGTHSSVPALPEDHGDTINEISLNTTASQKADHEEAGTSQNGGRKGSKGRKKKHKNKFMCFMPFYFLF